MSEIIDASNIDRSKYIGGSDCATILGRNEYASYLQCWRVKTGLAESDFDNSHMARGNYIEPLIEDYVIEHIDPTCNSRAIFEKYCPQKLDEYDNAIATGNRIPQVFLQDPVMPYVGGHPDGVGDKILHEFKAPAPRNLERALKEGFSVGWLYQMQHYMKILGYEQAMLHVWDFNKWEAITIPFKKEQRIWDAIDKVYPTYWAAVQLGVEPPAILHGHQEHFNYISDEEFDELLALYSQHTSARYDAEEMQKRAKGQIITYLDGRTRLETDNYGVAASHHRGNGFMYWKLRVRELLKNS